MALASSNIQTLPIAERIGAKLDAWRADYAQWKLYRQTLAELQSLDARERADLGLPTGGLKRIALEAVYGADI